VEESRKRLRRAPRLWSANTARCFQRRGLYFFLDRWDYVETAAI